MQKNKLIHAREVPVTIDSRGHQLVGIHHQAAGKKMVILCHGFTGNKAENKRLFVETARMLTPEGFNVLRFDFYGSGDSEGDFSDSLLSHNIDNLKDVIAWCREQGFANLAVLGISMGAATAILTVAKEPVEALVLWSAVPDLKQLFESYVENSAKLPDGQTSVEYDGWLIGSRFFADAVQYNVQESLTALTLPKLIIQGTADAPLFVQGFHRFRDIVTPPADFMEIPDAGHTFQTPQHRKQVIRQTVIWLLRHF
jgi:uncharacterized protein